MTGSDHIENHQMNAISRFNCFSSVTYMLCLASLIQINEGIQGTVPASG